MVMFDKEVYKARRDKLTSGIHSGIVLLLGNSELTMNYTHNTLHFRQDSTFLYFFGLDIPGIAAVLDIDEGTETIFGTDVSIDDIIWMGPQHSIAQQAESSGVNHAKPFGKLNDVIRDAIAKGRKVHFLPPYHPGNKILLHHLTGIDIEFQKAYASEELIKAVVSLRSVKEECEIEEIGKACAIGYKMHVKAMKLARPGIWEQKIAGKLEGIAVSAGGMAAFPVILSQHGETLHNHSHSMILEKGRLMVVDAGAETERHYCCDYTRTNPLGGKFSRQQREIYDIVLAANNRATLLIKPGVTYLSVHREISEVIAEGLTSLGLMRGNPREAVAQGAHALFFPHGLGHMMGLDAHDMEDLGQIFVGYDEEIRPSSQFGTSSLRMGRRLQSGFVITNEPGIYFIPALIEKWKNEHINSDFINFGRLKEYTGFGGIRLEDNILVTPDGSRILGKRVPVDPEEVEKITGKE